MAKSRKKKDWLGRSYVQHYDNAGNKVGTSRQKKSLFGKNYTQHYNQSGEKVSKSRSKTTLLGAPFKQHYDSSKQRAGLSKGREDVFCRPYTQHYEQGGDKAGVSKQRSDWLGRPYTEHLNQDRKRAEHPFVLRGVSTTDPTYETRDQEQPSEFSAYYSTSLPAVRSPIAIICMIAVSAIFSIYLIDVFGLWEKDAGHYSQYASSLLSVAKPPPEPQNNVTNQINALPKPKVSTDPKTRSDSRQGALGGLNQSSIKEIQTLLHKLGYQPGPIDGVWGENTAAALRKFEAEFQYVRHLEHETDQILFILRAETKKTSDRQIGTKRDIAKNARPNDRRIGKNLMSQEAIELNSSQSTLSETAEEEHTTIENGVWHGEWHGDGRQNTGQVWSIAMNIGPQREAVSISYPSLACGGVLSVIERAPSVLRLHETITYGKSYCIDGGDVKLVLSGNTIEYEWFYPDGRKGATGILGRVQ